jgi:hypothetical protein
VEKGFGASACTPQAYRTSIPFERGKGVEGPKRDCRGTALVAETNAQTLTLCELKEARLCSNPPKHRKSQWTWGLRSGIVFLSLGKVAVRRRGLGGSNSWGCGPGDGLASGLVVRLGI